MSNKRLPATTVKDLIDQLKDCDPDSYIRMPGDNMGVPIYVEEKPAYYDGGYWYFNHNNGKYVYTRSHGKKVDIYVKDLDDIIYENDGDIDKIKQSIDYQDKDSAKEFWDKIEREARSARNYERDSIKRFTYDVLKKIKHGYSVVQSIDDEIGRINVMWYHKPGSERRHRYKSPKSGVFYTQDNLTQGACQAVVKSFLFEPVKNEQERLIYWRLAIDK